MTTLVATHILPFSEREPMPLPRKVDCLNEMLEIEARWCSIKEVARILSQIDNPVEQMVAAVQSTRKIREVNMEERQDYTELETLWRLGLALKDLEQNEFIQIFEDCCESFDATTKHNDEERLVYQMQLKDKDTEIAALLSLRIPTCKPLGLIRNIPSTKTACEFRTISPKGESTPKKTTPKRQKLTPSSNGRLGKLPVKKEAP